MIYKDSGDLNSVLDKIIKKHSKRQYKYSDKLIKKAEKNNNWVLAYCEFQKILCVPKKITSEDEGPYEIGTKRLSNCIVIDRFGKEEPISVYLDPLCNVPLNYNFIPITSEDKEEIQKAIQTFKKDRQDRIISEEEKTREEVLRVKHQIKELELYEIVQKYNQLKLRDQLLNKTIIKICEDKEKTEKVLFPYLQILP